MALHVSIWRLEQLMYISTRSSLNSARATLALTFGIICCLTLAAPVLLAHSCRTAASVLYLSFSCICHQIPERSFIISGHPLAVCHRCFGIYIGLFLGSFIENRFIQEFPRARRVWVLAAAIPLLLDVFLSCIGLRTNTCLTRFLTGLLFGNLISPLLVRGVAEFLSEAPWRRLRNTQLEEVFHE
jgi:uncharacterized membrane protein